jgi:DNA-3-methyladenine glycosylase II
MTVLPLDDARLRAALDALARQDPLIGALLPRIGYPAPRVREPGFATLLRTIVAQQISTRAAAAIWGRLEAAAGDPLTAGAFLALTDADLRAVGFSARKVIHARALAEAIQSGALPVADFAAMADEAVIARLVAQPGFGRWSAEVYCLFALGRVDVFPADDLALQVAAQRLQALPTRPPGKLLRRLAESWRPWRGAAALFLWHYYGAATLDERRVE